ncbi:MAG: hypothetical protein ACR2KG_08830 [Nocardioidaceae bacterium]
MEQPLAELVRRWLGPVVAFVAASFAVICVVSVPDVIREADELAVLDPRFTGWVGVSGLVALGVAAAGLSTLDSLGAGPSVALGAAAAAFGLALARGVASQTQCVLALLVLGVAVGALVAAGICITLELPGGWSRVTLMAWGLPVLSGWAVATWVALHVPAGVKIRLAPHPSVWLVVAMAVLLAGWAVLTMLVEPPRVRDNDRIEGVRAKLHRDQWSGDQWAGAWAALVAVVVLAGLVVVSLGFEPGIALSWLRPVVVVATGGAVIGLLVVSVLVPVAKARAGYLTAVAVMLCVPTCVQLLVTVADAGTSRVSLSAVAVLVAAGWLGALTGWWRSSRGPVLGLLVVALSAIGGWVMPAAPLWLVLACGSMLFGFGTALFAALRLSNVSSVGIRFTALGLLSAILVGLVAQVPLSWALIGSLPADPVSARSAGRVFLGLTFALAVLVAAYASVLIGRTNGNGTTRPPGRRWRRRATVR